MRPGRSSRWSGPQAGKRARCRRPIRSRCESWLRRVGDVRQGEEVMNLVEQSLQIPAADVALAADVVVPEPAGGVVLFAHGSGSSRHSPRNRYVAGELQASRLVTVLADLLTPAEEQLDTRTGRLRFDIDLLALRVTALTAWLGEH